MRHRRCFHLHAMSRMGKSTEPECRSGVAGAGGRKGGGSVGRLPSSASFWGGENALKSLMVGTSLVVQGLRICLPTQGTQVGSLVGEVRPHMLSGD